MFQRRQGTLSTSGNAWDGSEHRFVFQLQHIVVELPVDPIHLGLRAVNSSGLGAQGATHTHQITVQIVMVNTQTGLSLVGITQIESPQRGGARTRMQVPLPSFMERQSARGPEEELRTALEMPEQVGISQPNRYTLRINPI